MQAEALLGQGAGQLDAAGIHNAKQEAGWLLAHVLQVAPLRVSACRGKIATDCQQACYRAMIARRIAGEPLQYILGSTEFYGLELQVGPGVLIPRPETERLVDYALAAHRGGMICDVCTGSGAIALALSHELGATVPVYGLDLSPAALVYAKANRQRLGLSAVDFICADLLTAVRPAAIFDLITANPPYVSPEEYAALSPEVAEHEPRLALYAADAGLAVLLRLLPQARRRLRPGGTVLAEIGSTQGEAAAAACRQAGFVEVTILQDYTGRDRILRGKAPAG